jgi:Uma2 family endonuclease
VRPWKNLVLLVHNHLKNSGLRGGFAPEVDVVIDQARVVRADMVYLNQETKQRQRAAAKAEGRRDLRRTRILVPPTLIIESISPGHEAHDRDTKMRWYAEFGVPNYWLLDVFAPTLECLILDGDQYRPDVAGRGMEDVLRPAAFAGLELPLKDVWGE